MINTLTDTIHKTVTILDTVKTSSASSLDLISKVDVFYNNAWTKLILAFSVVGVIFPIIVQLYQRKEYKDLKKMISDGEAKFKVDISEAEIRLRNEIRDEYQKALKDLIEESERKLIELKSENENSLASFKSHSKNSTATISYNFQSNIHELKGNIPGAIFNAFKALNFSLNLKSEGNNIIFFGRIKKLLSKTTKEDLDNSLDALETSFIEITDALKLKPKAFHYLVYIDELINIYKDLK